MNYSLNDSNISAQFFNFSDKTLSFILKWRYTRGNTKKIIIKNILHRTQVIIGTMTSMSIHNNATNVLKTVTVKLKNRR